MGLSRTLIFSDQDSLMKAAALYFAQAAHESIQERGRFLVGLSSGETSLRFYEALGSSPYREYLPWHKIHIFWCDEKCVPSDDEESHYFIAWTNWLKHISIPGGNIHRIHAEKEQTEAVIEYRQELEQFFENGRDYPILDWVLLHFGRDGQVGSLFPGGGDLLISDELVLPISIPSMGRLADRICLSLRVINQSRQVVIMASGPDKAESLASTIKAETDKDRWPAQRIKPVEGLLVWMVDESATRYSPS